MNGAANPKDRWEGWAGGVSEKGVHMRGKMKDRK